MGVLTTCTLFVYMHTSHLDLDMETLHLIVSLFQDTVAVHTKIRPKDVPGTLLNVALLNLGSSDPSLRSIAYNLLCALTQTFDLKIEGQLLETAGVLITTSSQKCL